MLKIGEQICPRCNLSRDLSFFQGKNDRSLKQCKSYQDKETLHCKQKKEEQNKENCNIHHVEIYDSKEMSIALNALLIY